MRYCIIHASISTYISAQCDTGRSLCNPTDTTQQGPAIPHLPPVTLQMNVEAVDYSLKRLIMMHYGGKKGENEFLHYT